jgi:hypothetical protein
MDKYQIKFFYSSMGFSQSLKSGWWIIDGGIYSGNLKGYAKSGVFFFKGNISGG